jgi:RNA polymerase sigma factor (sigma-70 family)
LTEETQPYLLDNSSYSEKQLLLKISEGDEKAFERLFNHYRPFLYTTSLRMTGEDWIAEEIVQDVFLKVWLNRVKLPEIENFGGWLYKIAGNLTLNAIKKEKSGKKTLNEWLRFSRQPDNLIDTSTDEENVYKDLLKSAINRLSPKQRQTYELIKVQGYKREEAARLMKVSSETVKWNLDQSLRNIRAYCMAKMDSGSAFVFFLVIFGK